jgi:tetratricopeptide (TPR) repeat protein
MRINMRFTFVAVAFLLVLGACAPKPVEFDLSVTATFDGQPLAEADVVVDGSVVGKTDASGAFARTLSKLPEHAVKVEVKKDSAKLHLTTWDKTFSIAPHKDGTPRERQAFVANLQRYVVVAVTHDSKPVPGALVNLGGSEAGLTAEDGTLQVAFGKWPAGGLPLSVKKEGVGEAEVNYKGDSGDKVEIPLFAEAIIKVEAVEERNGVVKPVHGASISVDGREVGKTGSNGVYTYHQKNKLGRTVPVRINAPGYVPSSFSHQVRLGGSESVRQFFYSGAAAQPRVAVFGFSANTKGEDISDVVKIVEPKFIEDLFDKKAFKQVPTATARSLAQRSKLNVAKLKTAGWKGTPLAEAVDVLVFGSIARGEDDTFIVEASFYEPDGKLVMTQAVVLSSTGSWRVGRAMSELVSNAVSSYPFSGVVVGMNDKNPQINLGRSQFDIESDDVFILKSAKRDEEGRITGYSDGGTYRVGRTGDSQTEIRPESAGAAPRLGDRVVRLNSGSSSKQDGADKVVFSVTGGKGGKGEALAGANLYIDEHWAGTTDRSGEASVQLRLGHKYKLIVYHHGYEQASKTIEPEKKGERFQFALKSFSSDLTVESEPSGAAVYLDDTRIGTTPITKPYPVTLGFHSLRVEAGGGYRAWEEVVEFDKSEEALTGSRMVTLYKDYLKMGEKAEDAGNTDEAIRLYSAAPREHPDYAELHNRLGMIYLDDKHDVDHALAEFERVQAIPEVSELVYKQYAVVYTNLGKAYYAKGESLVKTRRNDALEYFAKAAKALERARENTRFFPDDKHDEALHDTYYYRALAYQNLYQITGRESLRANVELAWNEYVDFFPEKLRGNADFEKLRESGLQMSKQFEGK